MNGFTWDNFDEELISSVVYSKKTRKDLKPKRETNDKDMLIPTMERIAPYPTKVIELEGYKLDTLNRLMHIHDFTRNREKTLYYCERILSLLGEAKEDIKDKIYFGYYLTRTTHSDIIKPNNTTCNVI